MVNNMHSKQNQFSLLLSIVLSIDSNYDYTIDYVENVARNIRVTSFIKRVKTR